MRLAAAAALLAVLAALPAPARAQAPGQTPISDPEIPPPRTPSPAPVATPMEPLEMGPRKSPGLALALSIGGTAAGIGLLSIASDNTSDGDALVYPGLAALFLGPSFGHWYAGDGAFTGLAMRGGGLLVELAGFAQLSHCYDGCPDRDENLGVGLVLTGSALFVVGGIYDIATAPRAASEWNARHAITMVPTALPSANGIAPGVALTGSF